MNTAMSKPRLRVAVLNRIFKSTGGGAERYSIALVEQLAARHDIHVFAQHVEHAWPGVTYHRVRQFLQRPRWINQLWFAVATWWLTRSGFDVVHSHENTWHGKVQTVHVLPVKFNLFHERHGWRRFIRWLRVVTSLRLLTYLALEALRYAPALGKSVIATSNSLREKVCYAYPRCQSKLTVVTPGVRDVPGLASTELRIAARQELKLPERGKCFLLVGNDYEKKGLRTALQTLAQLPDDIFLVVVGNAQHIPAFEPLVEALSIRGRVFFLGSMQDVSIAYQAADVLVHPTLEDTFAMVVLEAMAHGLPVLVSCKAFCGIAELLTDGVHGFILGDPRNSSTLAQLAITLVSDSVRYASMSDSCVQFARQYAWNAIADQQEKIYISAAGLGCRADAIV